jgi:hypothetical protein
MGTAAAVLFLASLQIAAPGAAAASADEKCAALDYLFAEARTEFPQLARAKLAPGVCSITSHEFKCRWGFSGDRFQSAKDQASRLSDCAAAASGAEAIKGKRGEMAYRLNPETAVFIRGPEMDSGEWALTLRIVTSSDWK